MSNSYGVTGTPKGQYAWYDFENGEWMGRAYIDERSAQIAVNLEFVDGDVNEEGYDDWNRAIVATAEDDGTVIKPNIISQDDFQAMIASALENWEFDPETVGRRYAAVKGVLEGMIGAEVSEIELAQNVAGPDDWDGLMEWCASIADEDGDEDDEE